MSKVKILVPVSGGKDSQACLKLARDHFPADQVRGLFCDTRFEHPLTYAHIEKMRQLYGVRIDVVQTGSVEEQVLKHGRFPSDVARFCTEELKIWPTKRYCKALAEEQGSFVARKKDSPERHSDAITGGFEVWYGMRVGESPARKKRYAGKIGDDLYPPHEVLRKYPKYLSKLGVMFRLAVLEWSEDDVKDYVGRENLNPLYEHFDRVGCFPCLAGGDRWKAKAFNHDSFGASQHARVIRLQAATGKSVWTSAAGKACATANDNSGPGCMLCAI